MGYENIVNTNNIFEPNYLQMIFGLITVVSLIYITGYIYQKLVKVNIIKTNEEDREKIEIVSSKYLGQNKSLYIIKVNNKLSLIGAASGSITFLKDINEN